MALGGGKAITYESLRDGEKAQSSRIETEDGRMLTMRRRLENFPNDVTYMGKDSIKTLLYSSSIGIKAKPWDQVRANAHLASGKGLSEYDLAAKRCSASEELWTKYTVYHKAGKDVSLELVKVWAEMEWIEELLKPQTWDISRAKAENIDPVLYRNKKLGDVLLRTLHTRYQELMTIN